MYGEVGGRSPGPRGDCAPGGEDAYCPAMNGQDGSMDRKHFLRAAGLGIGAGLLAGCAPEGKPDDVGARALNPPLERIGLQLYTVRALMEEDVPGTLNAVARIGYDEVEFAGYFGHAPAVVRGWLDAAGLAAPAAHVGMQDLSGAGLETAIETATVLGHRWLVLPYMPEEMRTADGYRELADVLNAAGAVAGDAGLRVGYHNHAFEFEAVEGAPSGSRGTGYALLLEHLDPALVDLEIDLHWSAVGGADAATLFAEHPGRFQLCHVKDLTADGRMADVGAGQIDWAALFALSSQAGLRHYFVEHDQPADPLASVTASYRYLSAT